MMVVLPASMDVTSTQFTLLQGIAAHPDEPSINELNRAFPSLELRTIREKLQQLGKKGYIEIDTDSDIRRYRLVENHTDIQESDFLDAKETLQHYFSRTE